MTAAWRRIDSLFVRLFLLQVVLAVLVMGLFGVFFYVERNRTVAQLQAQVWAPLLHQALPGLPSPGPAPSGASLLIAQRDAPPEQLIRTSRLAPRIETLRAALVAQGIPVGDIRFSRGEQGSITWLEVQRPGASPVWFGLAGHVIEARWPRRLLLVALIAGAAIAWASWWFTRRLTRPLERLRREIREGRVGAVSRDTEAPPEIAEIEAAHAELLRDLQQQERERSLLLAGVSHDLRSPLARIRMAVELMPASDETSPRRAAIVRNVQVVDRLVESFVDFVRSGELPLNETVDLVPLLRAVTGRLERPAAELMVELPETLVLQRANGLLIERLVANLLDNAFKHGRPPVRVVLRPAGNRAVLEVHDAGEGIAPAEREHLQQAFARGDTSRQVAGTGLGLAIARQGARRLGGQLSFEQTAEGHVVRLSLPLNR